MAAPSGTGQPRSRARSQSKVSLVRHISPAGHLPPSGTRATERVRGGSNPTRCHRRSSPHEQCPTGARRGTVPIAARARLSRAHRADVVAPGPSLRTVFGSSLWTLHRAPRSFLVLLPSSVSCVGLGFALAWRYAVQLGCQAESAQEDGPGRPF